MHTQINGPKQGNYALFLVKHKLRNAGVRVTSPVVKSYVLFNGRPYTYNPQKWSHYEAEAYHLKSIRSSAFHVVCNETPSQKGLIDHDCAISIVTAMLYRKPVVLAHAPHTDKSVNQFMSELIADKAPLFTVADITTLPDSQLAELAVNLPSQVDYALTKTQLERLKTLLKNHFNDIQNPVTRPVAYKLARASLA